MHEELSAAVLRLADQRVTPRGRDVASIVNTMMSRRIPIGHLPDKSCTEAFIYGLWCGDRLIYIGQTRQVAVRMRSHIKGDYGMRSKVEFDSYSLVWMECGDLDLLERRTIRFTSPEKNGRYTKPASFGFADPDEIALVLGVETSAILDVIQRLNVDSLGTRSGGRSNLFAVRPILNEIVRDKNFVLGAK